MEVTLLIVIVILCGLYMSWNIGANDVANAVGTSVGSGALTLKQAVILAGIMEFSGAFFFGDHVSKTVEEGILYSPMFLGDPRTFAYGFLACLVGAGVWLQIASYFGWPVSTTHSIIGALVGFGITVGGIDGVQWEQVSIIGFGWILTPIMGGILSYGIFTYILKKIIYVVSPLEATKRILPILTGLLASIFSLVFIYDEFLEREFPFYISFSICAAFGLTAGLISFFYFRRSSSPAMIPVEVPQENIKVLEDLEQARNYLKNVRKQSRGEMEFQLTQLVNEVDDLKSSLIAKQNEGLIDSEYNVVEKLFGNMQCMSACLMAFAHGANDVANAIGPLVAAISLLTTGVLNGSLGIPAWSLFLGGFGIVLGLATWGWRVIETIGKKLTELTPTRGFAAEFGAATTILIASRLGLPVSATHTLVGAVLGVGMARGIEALNLATMRNIIISWIVTIPMGAVISVSCYQIIKTVFG